ncbi:filamentous hemagglutinin N-terminal domain-containing protein [Sphaerothrix gracilis]|uniref:two-partner secretion domain-containing protein n=1 Tax=Sphaerothrix gracilis TaxID=3151835 RepID=UPI0031FC36E7
MGIYQQGMRLQVALRFGVAAVLVGGSGAIAQITPDATLGSEASVVAPDADVRGGSADLIQGGAVRGVNLFHSFADFNVAELQRVYFANPAGIENILGRVTGSSASDILGTLGVDGSANLFLLNPNGIVFGPNAQLDITGSFLASTAAAFDFNGQLFSATDPAVPTLLTVSLTPGLQYSAAQRGEIRTQAALAAGQDLRLDGVNLDLSGELTAGRNLVLQAQERAQIRDSAASPFIAAAGGELEIQGNEQVDIFALAHPESGLFAGGDLILRSGSPVIGDAYFWSGGSFRVEQLDGSTNSLLSPNDPVITAGGNVTFTSYVGGSLRVVAGGVVNIGSITINGTDPSFPDETVPLSRTLPDGTNSVLVNGSDRPVADIRAGVTNMGAPPGIAGTPIPNGLQTPSQQPIRADILVDRITINQPNGLVFLSNQYQPNNLAGNIEIEDIDVSVNSGNAGEVLIDSRGAIDLTGTINTSNNAIERFARFPIGPVPTSGNGGAITFLASEDITLNPGATIETIGAAGGQVTLESDRQILVNRGIISSISVDADSPDVGDIELSAFDVIVANGGLVATAAAFSGTGSGKGGTVWIRSANRVAVINDDVLNSPIKPVNTTTTNLLLIAARGTAIGTSNLFTASSGDVIIETERLQMQNLADPATETRAGIATFTDSFSSGSSGDITVIARRSVEITGNQTDPSLNPALTEPLGVALAQRVISIRTGITAATNGTGKAGDIDIKTQVLTIRDSAGISAGSVGSGLGEGGLVKIAATDSVQLDGFAAIATGTVGVGNGGDVQIKTPQAIFRNGSGIAADSVNDGNAGQIDLQVDDLTVASGSRIGAATSDSGDGGEVAISASNSVTVEGTSPLNSTISSGIYTSAEGQNIANAGSINITTDRLTIRNGGRVSAESQGAGQAGSLTVNDAELVEVIGTSTDGSTPSQLLFDSQRGGDAGELNIDTQQLIVREGGRVTATTFNQGQGGLLNVDAEDAVIVEGTDSALRFESRGAGDARGIAINTDRLQVAQGGQITVSGTGTGRSGDLAVTTEGIALNQGQLRSNTLQSDGGNIDLQVNGSIGMRNASEISAEAFSTANGGNIFLTVDGLIVAVLEENSDVVANAQLGRGGNITAEAARIFGFRAFQGVRTPISDFTSATPLGIDGGFDVLQQGRNVDEFPVLDFVDPTRLIDRRCELQGRNDENSFVITGYGGLPASPAQPLMEEGFLADLGPIPLQPEMNRSEAEPRAIAAAGLDPEIIIEPQGWVRDEAGTIRLVAGSQTIAWPHLVAHTCRTPATTASE